MRHYSTFSVLIGMGCVCMCVMAECRLRKVGLQRGRAGRAQKLAIITSQIWRRVSTVVTKANVNCLVERMQLVGPGNTELGRRRSTPSGWSTA